MGLEVDVVHEVGVDSCIGHMGWAWSMRGPCKGR